mgnify:FL=1
MKTDSDLCNESEDEEIDVSKIRKKAARNLKENRIRQNVEFNKRRCAPKMFIVGDKVLTKVTSFPANNESKKLLPKYRGPFTVVEVLPNDRYKVKECIHSERSQRMYEAIVGVENMKPFVIQEC